MIDPLCGRELEVLRLLPTHLTGPEIARELYISRNTVRSHIGHIYDKLDVHSRTEAVQRAQELGLLEYAPASRQMGPLPVRHRR